MPPVQDTAQIDKRTAYMSAATAEMGILSVDQTDSKVLEDLQASGEAVDVTRHRFIVDTCLQFPNAVPKGHDLKDVGARTAEQRSIFIYSCVLSKHLRDVTTETRVRSVDMCRETEIIAGKILAASREPGAPPEIVAAAAQIDRYEKTAKTKEKIDDNRIERAKLGLSKDMDALLLRAAQQEQEIAELRRQLGLRLAAETAPTPPTPPTLPNKGGRSTPR